MKPFLDIIKVKKHLLRLKQIRSQNYLRTLTIIVINGGETGIRTQERVAPLPVFKTGAFNRSAISPLARFYKYNKKIQQKMSIIKYYFAILLEFRIHIKILIIYEYFC